VRRGPLALTQAFSPMRIVWLVLSVTSERCVWRSYAQKRRDERVRHANWQVGELAPVIQHLGTKLLRSRKKRLRHFATVPALSGDDLCKSFCAKPIPDVDSGRKCRCGQFSTGRTVRGSVRRVSGSRKSSRASAKAWVRPMRWSNWRMGSNPASQESWPGDGSMTRGVPKKSMVCGQWAGILTSHLRARGKDRAAPVRRARKSRIPEPAPGRGRGRSVRLFSPPGASNE